MPKVILTQKQREAQAIDREVQMACQTLLTALGEKRGREEKQYAQIAKEIGVSSDRYRLWRKGKLPEASFGRVLAAWAKLGYRLVPEPIAGRHRQAANPRPVAPCYTTREDAYAAVDWEMTQ